MTFAMNDTMVVTLTARVTTAHLRVDEVDDRLEHIAKHLGGDSGAEEDGGFGTIYMNLTLQNTSE